MSSLDYEIETDMNDLASELEKYRTTRHAKRVIMQTRFLIVFVIFILTSVISAAAAIIGGYNTWIYCSISIAVAAIAGCMTLIFM